MTPHCCTHTLQPATGTVLGNPGVWIINYKQSVYTGSILTGTFASGNITSQARSPPSLYLPSVKGCASTKTCFLMV